MLRPRKYLHRTLPTVISDLDRGTGCDELVVGDERIAFSSARSPHASASAGEGSKAIDSQVGGSPDGGFVLRSLVSIVS